MQLEKIIKYLDKNGWKQIKSNEKFAFYNPPKDLGFPKDYTLPIPTKIEAPDFQKRVNETAQIISEIYGLSPSQLFYDVGDYKEMLKKDAIYFKLSSSEVLYSHTLELDHIWQFLKNLSLSFSNYVKIKFSKKFEKHFVQNEAKMNRAANKLLEYSQLRLVDLQFDSFCFGVSIDTMMGNQSIDIQEVIAWRKEIMATYKKEVIGIYYSSKEDIDFVLQTFTPEERKKIFEPYIKGINKHEYTLSLTDPAFQTKRIYSRIPASTLKLLIPFEEKEQTPLPPKMMQILVPVDRSKSKITLKTEEIENNLFAQQVEEKTFQINKIEYKEQKIILKSPIDLTLKQDKDTGEFILIFPPLAYEKRGSDFRRIQDEFFKDLFTYVDYYGRLKQNRKNIHSEKELKVLAIFDKILPKK